MSQLQAGDTVVRSKTLFVSAKKHPIKKPYSFKKLRTFATLNKYAASHITNLDVSQPPGKSRMS